MSNWLNDTIAVGDVPRRHDAARVLRRARPSPAPPGTTSRSPPGSGITPVLSHASQRPRGGARGRGSPSSSATAARASMMFLEELAGPQEPLTPTGFQLVHVLSREPQDVELFTGRLDRERLRRILDALVPSRRRSTSGTCAGRSAWSRAPRRCSPTRGVDAAPRAPRDLPRRRAGRRRARTVVVEEGAPPAAVVTVNLDGRTTRHRDADPRRDHPRRDAAGPSGRAVLAAPAGSAAPAGRAWSSGRGADGPQLRPRARGGRRPGSCSPARATR